MLQVGLTGGIASGKSTVARMFQEKGAFLIDLDELAHLVEEPGQPGWEAIVGYFGSDILNDDRTVNREKLGDIVFHNKEKLARLNDMIHPAVFAEWERRVREIEKRHPRAIVISDIPLLFEAGIEHWFEVIILVYVSPEDQIQRLMIRSGCDVETAQIRLDSQMPISDKIAYADFVIDNGCPIGETGCAVDSVWEELLKKERKKREGKITI